MFFSADPKCKISVGEPGFPLAAVARGKKVIVGENEVADHDYSKLPIIPDGILVHQIPETENVTNPPEKITECETQESQPKVGGWYAGNVHYCFKNMVSEGSTSLRGIAEIGKVLDKEYQTSALPERLYPITDGAADRNIVHVSVQNALVSLFLKFNLVEILAVRTAAYMSCYNPIERVHARCNLALQSVAMMRREMSPKMERLMKNANSNDDIRNLCEKHPEMTQCLRESLDMPIKLLENLFEGLSVNESAFPNSATCIE